MVKEIIILTKSNKHGGYCIAGIDTKNGKWIRLVSSNSASECAVPEEQLQFGDGSVLEILDVIAVDILEYVPSVVQKENYLYDERERWIKLGKATLNEVVCQHGFDDTNDYILYNRGYSVIENEITDGKSLYLLKVKSPSLYINQYNKTKFNFLYNNNWYFNFSVSDSNYVNKNTDFDGKDVVVVFSLTDKFERTGKYYKMVANIFDIN